MKVIALAALGLLAAEALASDSHYVRPYVRNDGTYVGGHMQTNPNNSRMDNWSTQGNVNPYTGRGGTADPYAAPPRPAFDSSPNGLSLDPLDSSRRRSR